MLTEKRPGFAASDDRGACLGQPIERVAEAQWLTLTQLFDGRGDAPRYAS